MKFLDLFSGIGGFSLGLERVGMQCVGHVELDPFCQKVLLKHWPDVPLIADIRDVRKDSFEPVELVCGGFPCQSVSQAGKRKGILDDRYLWPEMLAVVEMYRPTWVIAENVTGLGTMVKHRVPTGVESRTVGRTSEGDRYSGVWTRQEEMLLGSICRDLESLSYTVQPIVVPACAVGAPHIRSRIWILAHSQIERRRQGKSQAGRRERPSGPVQPGKQLADSDTGGQQVLGKPDQPQGSLWDQPDGCGQGGSSGQDVADSGQSRRRTGDAGGRRAEGQQLLCEGQEEDTGPGRGQREDVAHSAPESDDRSRDSGQGRRRESPDGGQLGDAPSQRVEGDGSGREQELPPHARQGLPLRPDNWNCFEWVRGWDGRFRRVPLVRVRGVDDGLSNRVDGSGYRLEPLPLTKPKQKGRVARLRALGNAIVPAVVEEIGRAIMLNHRRKSDAD